MSFTQIDTSLPDGDTLAEAINKINAGFTDTLREIVLGTVPGWAWSYTGADPLAPTAEIWTNGTNILCIEYTYSMGRVATALYRYSTNSGGSYTNKGIETFTYDGNGFLLITAWS